MLPPFIIDQIRRREEEERRRPAPVIELPLPQSPAPREPRAPEEKPRRGVVIIDLG